MVESHDRLFRGVLFGSTLVGEVEAIRHLSKDVALVHGTGSWVKTWCGGGDPQWDPFK